MERFDFTPSVADTLGLGNRQRGDGCPGALSMHKALDGSIGRIRIAGGRASAEQLVALANLADIFGDGNIHVTTRGNVQIRGISDESGFSGAVCEAGLLPSAAHDKVRNIIASPRSSLVDAMVAQFDAALLASNDVTKLSGRTLFAFDDGDGSIAAHRPDFGVLVCRSESTLPVARIIVGGVETRLFSPVDSAADVLVTAAALWQSMRGDLWRVQESPELRQALVDKLREHPAVSMISNAAVDPTNPDAYSSPSHNKAVDAPIGWLEREDGLVDLGGSLRFGVLSSRLARILAATDKPVCITPWAGVVIRDLHPDEADAVVRVLAPLGLVFDAGSPWLRLSACTGLPGCAKSRSDVRADALVMLQQDRLPDPEPLGHEVPVVPVHFSGCERRCGHPLGEYWDYLAEGSGEYDVEIASGVPATAKTFTAKTLSSPAT